jgi:HSP20 family protein
MKWNDPEDRLELEKALEAILKEVAGDSSSAEEDSFDGPAEGFLPSVDVEETGGGVRVVAELPGVAPDSLKLLAGPGSLVIKGEWGGALPKATGKPIRVETRKGPFSRILDLPEAIDGERAEAVLENGVLTVELPFRAEK